ncbi:MAG: KGG domain-containing protein [Lachnospiraceae bacterium]
MAGGHENLIPFSKRSVDEAREFGKKGGKASGETRRKNKAFKDILNALFAAEINHEEWTPVLKAMGLDSTVGDAINAAMVRKAMEGDVRAYEAIAKYSGQAAKTEADTREQEAKIKSTELDNAEKEQKTASNESGGLASAIMEAYERRKRGEADV